MLPDSDFLFVYGTLGPSFTNAHAAFLHQNSGFVGPGTIPGQLIDLGNYPGAIYDATMTTRVCGFVYNISTRKSVLLATLDTYEGIGSDFPEPHEYVRVVVPVLNQGNVVHCWTYLYNLNSEAISLIDFGDYALFLNDRKQKSRP